MKRVVLGISGGVDSAVCAALLKEQGYKVYGVFLDFGLISSEDAQKVCSDLGIDFFKISLSHELERNVCSYFRSQYLNGYTPNPCVVCNKTVKFRSLCDFADKHGVYEIATGHYANVQDGKLKKSPSLKDQSYMLYRLGKNTLKRVIFPIGHFKTKDEVRRAAEIFNIKVKSKPDSMDICFIPDGDHTQYIKSHGLSSATEGDFIDEEGNILGRHKGIYHYTVGQRRGLNISASGRLYVKEILPESNQVVLSLRCPLCLRAQINDVHFILDSYANMADFCADIKVRYTAKTVHGRVIMQKGNNRASILFEDEVRAVSPGQSAVFYTDDGFVIGGGFFEK